jgi:hypothetical protein
MASFKVGVPRGGVVTQGSKAVPDQSEEEASPRKSQTIMSPQGILNMDKNLSFTITAGKRPLTHRAKILF